MMARSWALVGPVRLFVPREEEERGDVDYFSGAAIFDATIRSLGEP